MRRESALSLLFPAFLLLPPCGGFAVKRNEGGFLSAVAGCGAAVGLLQVVDHDAGVILRGVDRAVAQKLLDVPDRCPAPEHFRRAAMAQAVDGVNVAEVRGFAVLAEALAQDVRAHQKQAAVGLLLFEQDGPDLAQVFGEELGGDFADRHLPVFAAFALDDPDDAALQVEVVRRERAELRASEAAGVKQFEDAAIAEAFGGG